MRASFSKSRLCLYASQDLYCNEIFSGVESVVSGFSCTPANRSIQFGISLKRPTVFACAQRHKDLRALQRDSAANSRELCAVLGGKNSELKLVANLFWLTSQGKDLIFAVMRYCRICVACLDFSLR